MCYFGDCGVPVFEKDKGRGRTREDTQDSGMVVYKRRGIIVH
jgi:hypothetical protein